MAANKIGIQVTGANATIDLNGFTMQGSNVAWHGITGGVDGVTIKNGTITGFDFDGIVGTGDNWIVENMRVVANGRYGVSLIGDYSSVRDSTVTQNRNSGIQCNNRCLVEDSNSSGNGGRASTSSAAPSSATS